MTQEIGLGNRDVRVYSYILAVTWAVFVFGMLVWGVARTKEATERLANYVAKAHFDKDQAVRLWAASHGGVYVPTDARTPPNPHLEHVFERDLRTVSGRELTLMNPAYMLRQLHEDFAELYGIKGHLTSLKPLRPDNRPDEWEEKALQAFERGAQQVSEYTEIGGKPYLRFIRPMPAVKDCLKCHTNHQEGDIRGGVGIALPMENFIEAQRSEIQTLTVSHGSIFVIGLLGIWFGTRRLEQRQRERDQALAALRASEQKYRRLFDDSKDGVFISSRDGKLIEANGSLAAMFGFTMEETAGIDVNKLYADPSDREKFQEVIEHTGSVKDYEGRFCTKEGKLIHCVLTANVRLDEDGSVVGYQGVVRDITAQKKVEESLKRQAKELERSNTDLEQFAFVVSHDLQEPLRNVTTCVQMLEKRYWDKLGPDAAPLIHHAVESVAWMQTLIRDLLAYSRISTRGKPHQLTDCEKILEQTISHVRSIMKETNATITYDPLPTVTADPVQLLQVFQNLITNALKFRGHQPPKVHVAATRDGAEWIFSVKDNGIGIERQHLERIFVIFRRLHKKTEYEGTGIGLAVVKKIMERHHGRVWVESDPGTGSTFFLAFPAGQEIT